MHYYYGRTICDVLEAMRKTHEASNYSYLTGLINEAQDMANRMESALELSKTLKEMEKNYKELKGNINKLEKEKKLQDKKA